VARCFVGAPDRNRDKCHERNEEKRDFSLRRPTVSQERSGKKKRRPAPFEMTCGGRRERDV